MENNKGINLCRTQKKIRNKDDVKHKTLMEQRKGYI
jgi:hypothetical protein